MITIAIDGPSGAGKSSIAKALAKDLGITYLDTGAMYRALGLKVLRNGVAIGDEAGIMDILNHSAIDIAYIGGAMHIFLDEEDVSEAIRENPVSKAASDVSAIGAVRVKLVQMQRSIAQGKSVVMDGRDIGTHVLPDASYKFFVTASPETRAERRYRELAAKGTPKPYEEVLAEMIARDRNDSTRKNSPLEVAQGAIVVDTTGLSLEQAIDYIKKQIRE